MRLFFSFNITAIIFISLIAITDASAHSTKHNSYISHIEKNNRLIITTTVGNISLSAVNKQAIEVHYQIKDDNSTAANLPSYAIKEGLKVLAPTVINSKNKITFSTTQIKAVIQKSPFHISFYQGKRLLVDQDEGFFTTSINEDEKIHAVQGFSFKLSEHEKLLGGGERVLGMDRRGHRMPLYNRAHYGYTTESNQMNFSIPAVMSSNKYILLFDNSAKGWMDLGKTDKNIMKFEAVSGRMAYIVFAGNSYPDLMQSYVEVTGKQPMPPRWAFGNYASRFGYRTEQEVRDTVNKFIDLDFPLDALILDLYWFGKDIKGHMGNLAWDKAAFPTPIKMIKDIKAQGVNTVLITEPFILTNSGKYKEAEVANALAKNDDGNAKHFDFYFGNTSLVDVFSHDGKKWFNEIYKEYHQQGVEGWWGDLGEPEVHPGDTLHTLENGKVVNADAIHNVYGHQWAKMLYENQRALAPTKRPFILMRSGFAGSQRYGMIPWTGDVSREWGGLKPQVELSLQMGVLGMAYTHSDLGGFAGGEKFDKEMYIRWLQYGVFQPIYRPHAQDNIAPEVVFHDKQTQDILRKFIKLRYKLLPYNYTLAYQNSTTGMPLMRPLFFDQKLKHEVSRALIDNATSYLWGDAFLVTPVVDAGVKSVSVPLPQGVWFDYFSDERFVGNQKVNIKTTIETLPVLVRAGSFIPMIDDIQSTQDYDTSKLTLHYYADKSVKNSESEMFEDDGVTPQSIKKGLYELLTFTASQQNQALTISLTQNSFKKTKVPSREITLIVHNLQIADNKSEMANVMANNKKIAAQYNKKAKTLITTFTWQHEDIKIEINR